LFASWEKSKVEIVRQLHLEPREVQRLWEEWSTGFEDSAEAKMKAELRARHETRQRHAADSHPGRSEQAPARDTGRVLREGGEEIGARGETGGAWITHG
jgi:hypothetical protein